ncbi:MAG: hypothetical protein WCT22_04240, partial [Patescibacteria group bacterium]
MTNQKDLKILESSLEEINSLLLDPKSQVIKDFFKVISKYGTPTEINKKAIESGKLSNILKKLKKIKPAYIKD